MIQIDTPIAITVITLLVSLAAWVGALSQRVNHNTEDIIKGDNLTKEAIDTDRKGNREDHQLIFAKLEEINKFIRNGQH